MSRLCAQPVYGSLGGPECTKESGHHGACEPGTLFSISAVKVQRAVADIGERRLFTYVNQEA